MAPEELDMTHIPGLWAAGLLAALAATGCKDDEGDDDTSNPTETRDTGSVGEHTSGGHSDTAWSHTGEPWEPCQGTTEAVDLTEEGVDTTAIFPEGAFAPQVFAVTWQDGVQRDVTVRFEPDLAQVSHFVPDEDEDRADCQEGWTTAPTSMQVSWDGGTLSDDPAVFSLNHGRRVATHTTSRSVLPEAIQTELEGVQGLTRWTLDWSYEGVHGGIFTLPVFNDDTGSITADDRIVHVAWGDGL